MRIYHFRLHSNLQDTGHELAPEIEKDAHGGVMRFAAWSGAIGHLLKIQRPQLAQDECVEQCIHALRRRFGLLHIRRHYGLQKKRANREKHMTHNN